ncbi:hypothetical protein Hanom_Chr07g00586991 [Helianthus anomalus]
MSELQILSFIFILFCRRCPLSLKLTNFVVNVSKSCTLCPLSLTKLIFFFVKRLLYECEFYMTNWTTLAD